MMNNRTMPTVDINNHIIPTPVNLTWGEKMECLSDYVLFAEIAFDDIIASYRQTLHLNDDGKKIFRLEMDPSISIEGYVLEVRDNTILVRAKDPRGFFYALMTIEQLREGVFLPEVKIEDEPLLALRGFHMNLGTIRQLRSEDVKRILGILGKYKINTVILEYTDKFPYLNHPTISQANAFSMEDVCEFEKLAADFYIDVIPLCQCLGHCGYILKHKRYRSLLEENLRYSSLEQLCPSNPNSLLLFRELASELMDSHPQGRYFHIGADEAQSLGKCSNCAAIAQEKGVGWVFVEYVNKVSKWVKAKGRIPVMWDDMLSRHLDVIEYLDKEIVIMYWDYWTTSLKSPFVVARGSGKGLVHDLRWENEWAHELSEVENVVVSNFSSSGDLRVDLTKDYLDCFGGYLGDDFPKRMNGFPYLRYFQDKGFKVIGAPSTLGNRIDETFGMPNYNRYLGNIRAFSNKCSIENALGIVTTAWYNFPAEILDLGIMSTAQYTWKGSD